MARKPTDTVQLKLRFPEAMRRRLERVAGANDRSMNAEIIHRLDQSFRKDGIAELIQATAKETAEKVVAQWAARPTTEAGKRTSRGIILDEIKKLLATHFPPTSAEHKRERTAVLRKHFQAAWAEIEKVMPLYELRAGYASLHQELEGVLPPTAAEPPRLEEESTS